MPRIITLGDAFWIDWRNFMLRRALALPNRMPEPSTMLLMFVAVTGCMAAQFVRRTKTLT